MNKVVKRTLQIGIPVVVIGALLVPRLNLFSGSSTAAPLGGQRGAQGTLPVSGVVAQLTRSSNAHILNGEFYPNEVVDLVSETAGKVVKINFNDGDRVKKGDLLVKVDDADLQVQLQRALYQKQLTEKKLERQRLLYDRESVSLESLQELETEYDVLCTDIALLQVKIDRTEIRAPFGGKMGFRQISPGAYLQPSTPVATLTDDSVLLLEFYLPEKYLPEALIGKKFTFHHESVSEPIEVEVYAIDPMVDTSTRTYLIRGRYVNRLNLLPGMFLSGELIWGNDEYIPIPTQSLVPEMDGQRAWVVRGGRAALVPVTIGGRTNTHVEVLTGIGAGDTVLTTGLMQVREGMALQVTLQP